MAKNVKKLFLESKKVKTIGRIEGRKITTSRFNHHLTTVKVWYALFTENKNDKNIRREYNQKTWQFLLLLWKAEKDKIEVTDEEVINRIRTLFTYQERFHKELYLRFVEHNLRMRLRTFEECIRDFIKIERVVGKYIKIEVSDEEIKKLYQRDTQKAKIAYIFVPYEKFSEELNLSKEEVEEFYLKNKSLFKEEPRVKIKYVIFDEDNSLKDKILEKLASIKNINELSQEYSLTVKETGFIGLKDPIEGFGWDPKINNTAFLLKQKEISAPLTIQKNLIIMEKIDEQDAFIPGLERIYTKVETELKDIKAEEKVKNTCREISERIKNEKDITLKEIAKDPRFEFKTTDYFKYSDSIEGLELNEQASRIIFSLEKDDIHPEPLFLLKGGYIIQLADITALNEEDFKNKKDTYSQRIRHAKNFRQELQFINRLANESQLEIYPFKDNSS